MKIALDKKRLLTLAGYAAFAGVSLLLSFYFTFPAAALGQRIAHELERSTHGVWHVTFNDVSTYRFTGIEAQGVTLQRTLPGTEPLTLQLDALRARLRVLPLLLLRTSVDAGVTLGEGTLDARLTPRGAAADAHLDADNVSLTIPPILAKLTGVPVGGTVVGQLDLTWDNDPQKTQGTASFTLDKLSVGPGKIAGFSVPLVDLGTVELGVDVQNGKLNVTTFRQRGGSLSLQASGTMQLVNPPPQSALDVCVAFRAEPAFLGANPTMRSALSLAEVQLKKDNEGYLHLPLAGPAAMPQIRFGGLCKRGG
jgi:type II secretion system protein N